MTLFFLSQSSEWLNVYLVKISVEKNIFGLKKNYLKSLWPNLFCRNSDEFIVVAKKFNCEQKLNLGKCNSKLSQKKYIWSQNCQSSPRLEMTTACQNVRKKRSKSISSWNFCFKKICFDLWETDMTLHLCNRKRKSYSASLKRLTWKLLSRLWTYNNDKCTNDWKVQGRGVGFQPFFHVAEIDQHQWMEIIRVW